MHRATFCFQTGGPSTSWAYKRDFTSFVELQMLPNIPYLSESNVSPNRLVCGLNPKVRLFKYELLSSTFLWCCCSLCCTRWF